MTLPALTPTRPSGAGRTTGAAPARTPAAHGPAAATPGTRPTSDRAGGSHAGARAIATSR